MGEALKAGDVLSGKYRLEQVLGRGGMGTVHLATHLVLGQRVAIKILNPKTLAGDGDKERRHAVARFLREARAAALLESEHVVRVLDVSETDDGVPVPFIVMEYLQGKDLGARLREGGRLSIGEAVGHVLDACEALAEAHAAGIVHRDLKPSNLFLAETARKEPILKLLDFGISKLTAPGEDLSLTETQAVIGSPLFMSPEQLLSARDVDHRTDLWSLGITLYQLVSGALPFEASTATALGAQIAATSPRPLSEALPEVPAGLEAAVMRCLARAPADRFADVAGLARAIAPFAERGEERTSAVMRAEARGARDRALPASHEPGAPPVEEASGERWTQSRSTPPPAWVTQSRSTPPPKTEPANEAAAATPDALAKADLVTAKEDIVPKPDAKPTSRLAWVAVGVGLLLVVGIVVVALRKPVAEATNAPSPSAPPSTAATPSVVTSEAVAPASASASATPAATTHGVRPPATGRPRPGKAGTKPAWSKDPSELDIK